MQAAVDWVADNTMLMDEFAKIIKKREVEPLDEITASLLLDAFIFDHKLVGGKTPFEIFLADANISSHQKDVFESYKNNIYSLFEVIRIDLGKGLELFDIVGKNNYYIKERRGTYSAEKGSIIVGRITKTVDGFVAISPAFNSFPKDAAFLLKKIFEPKSRFKLTSFDILDTLLKKTKPPKSYDELVDDLQNLTEKYGIGVDIDSIGKRINDAESPDEAFPEVYHAIIPEGEKRELTELLNELWNKHPRKEFNDKSPQDMDKKGPKEKMLIHALMIEITRKINPDKYPSIKSALEAANQMKDRWISTPQKDLDGRTPLNVMLEERKNLKNPDKDFNLNITLSKL